MKTNCFYSYMAIMLSISDDLYWFRLADHLPCSWQTIKAKMIVRNKRKKKRKGTVSLRRLHCIVGLATLILGPSLITRKGPIAYYVAQIDSNLEY